jgi:hypothetical protein
MPRSADAGKGLTAIVLGTNEIASAVGVFLHRVGYGVVLSQDDDHPVLRRKMAFHDALFGDTVKLDEVRAERADNGMQIFNALRHFRLVQVTWLGLPDLLPVGSIDVLIDARLQAQYRRPDLRGLARFSIGLGPGFVAGGNCDAAVVVPAAICAIDPASIVSALHAGRWHGHREIGAPVYRGEVIGDLSGDPQRASCDGVLRGLVRDGREVAAGITLLEIDRRGRHAQWTGIDDHSRAVAKAVLRSLKLPAASKRRLKSARFPA